MVAIKKGNPQPDDWDDIPGIDILSAEEGIASFDRRARELVHMSGEEFLRRLDAGEFPSGPDVPEDRNYNHLIMLLPFAGRSFS